MPRCTWRGDPLTASAAWDGILRDPGNELVPADFTSSKALKDFDRLSVPRSDSLAVLVEESQHGQKRYSLVAIVEGMVAC